MTSTEKAQHIAEAADEMKAENVETLDVRQKTSVADYFVICSGTSDRHVQSIAERVAEKMTTLRSKPLREDTQSHAWVLQDYGDVVLHVMRDEQRQFFDLETLWKTMQPNPDLPA
jgi:ribosome-associated protein